MPRVTLTIEQIYRELCPACKDKIITMIANAATTSSIKEQLQKQLDQSPTQGENKV